MQVALELRAGGVAGLDQPRSGGTQLLHPLVQLLVEVGDPHPGEIAHGELFSLFTRKLAHPDRRQSQILKHRQMRKQVELLKHHADFAANELDILEVRRQFHAFDQDLAVLVLLQPVDAADRG